MTALAQPVAAGMTEDNPVAQAIANFQAESKKIAEAGLGPRERFEALNKAANDAVGALKIEELPIESFEVLADQRLVGRLKPELQKRMDERLATLAKDTGAPGARAAIIRATFNPTPMTEDEASWKAVEAEGKNRSVAAMTHPGLPKAVETGKAKWLLAAGGFDSALADAAYADALTKVVALPLAPEAVVRLWNAYLPLAGDGAPAPAEAREKLRVACADKTAKALSAPTESAAPDTTQAAKDRTRKALEDNLKSFNGAYAKGQLVGYTAPEITFDWSTIPGGAKKLSDLKGKVVVIDFWATWCGPCVASFPQVRDLQARYKDFPVVILGVTDMPGTPRPQVTPGQPVEWKPEVQFPALEAWAKDEKHEMTWPIAVGTSNVFNPEYGIMGIPHVVILDPDGKVRYRGLHPAMEPEKKHEYIDGILKEFKLPAPTN
jgi:thiol-disulfide isomerase/thioredoxin